jgi:transcriptional regulator with XRE-family HTH domain
VSSRLTFVKLDGIICIMGTREIARGPVAEQVRRNVAVLRRKRGMSLADLSEAMTLKGRPILASGLGKIETGDRRVDVDDLVALALALDVSPVRLLLPADVGDVPEPEPEREHGGHNPFLHRNLGADDVALTPQMRLPWRAAWEWASGDEPFVGIDRHGDWHQENRPHGKRRLTAGELGRLAAGARDAGLALERAALLLDRASGKEPPPATSAGADVRAARHG